MGTYGFFQVTRRLFSSANMTKQFKNHLRFDWNPSQISEQAKQLITESKGTFDAIGSLNASTVTPANVITALNEMHRTTQTKQSSIDFLQNVSPSKEVREASRDADKTLSDFWVETSMRKDIFDRLCDLQKRVDNGEFTLTAE